MVSILMVLIGSIDADSTGFDMEVEFIFVVIFDCVIDCNDSVESEVCEEIVFCKVIVESPFVLHGEAGGEDFVDDDFVNDLVLSNLIADSADRLYTLSGPAGRRCFLAIIRPLMFFNAASAPAS